MTSSSKSQEALQDAESTQLPPPAYGTSTSSSAGTEEFEVVQVVSPMANEKTASVSDIEEKRSSYPPGLDTAVDLPQPVLPDEKRAIERHYAETQVPSQSTRPIPTLATQLALEYTLSWHRAVIDRTPYLSFPSLSIHSTNGSVLPSTMPDMPSTSHWRLNYHQKYFARLHRYTVSDCKGDNPSCQLAEIKFPHFMPGSIGPTIKFEPHEEEIARTGSRHVSKTDKYMHCVSGWTTSYGIDLPVFKGSRVIWKVGDGNNGAEQPTGETRHIPSSDSNDTTKSSTRLVTVGDFIEQIKNTAMDKSWTPYPQLELVEENTNRLLAVYTRAAPWAKDAGRLTIVRPDEFVATPEYIEGIIIACAAVVGMQDRMGLLSSLVEASMCKVPAKKHRKKAETAVQDISPSKVRAPQVAVQQEGDAAASKQMV